MQDTEPAEEYVAPSIDYPVGLILNPELYNFKPGQYDYRSLTKKSGFGDEYSAKMPDGNELLLKSDNRNDLYSGRTLIRITSFSDEKGVVEAEDVSEDWISKDYEVTRGFIDTAIDAIRRVTEEVNGLENKLEFRQDNGDDNGAVLEQTQTEAEIYLALLDGLDEINEVGAAFEKLRNPLARYKEACEEMHNKIYVYVWNT